MSILVTYASKHGATQQIAERIGEKLRAAGLDAEVRPVKAAGDLAGYDAFVIGSAVYYESWLKEAANFVRRREAVLAGQPVWLFSSGPLGTAATDAQGRDLREVAEPKDIAELKRAIQPRDHHVFFGALDHHSFGFTERMVWALPAARELLIEGDFRNWADVEAWADSIAQELVPGAASDAKASEVIR
jgi:menaquinone-dependent protoporphyrinogen oxidase